MASKAIPMATMLALRRLEVVRNISAASTLLLVSIINGTSI
jgi:hypothetical protein